MPDAVTVTLYVAGCPCCEVVELELLLEEPPHPVKLSRHRAINAHRVLLFHPNGNSERGETSARIIPDGANNPWLLFIALTVIVVLCAALPDKVDGEKLQLHPFGRPVHAKDREALNPFSGVTDTFRDPDVPCATERVLLESASA